MTSRLVVIAHAATDAMRAARLPTATDAPIDATHLRPFARSHAAAESGPEPRCTSTALALGLSATKLDVWADQDQGDWAGRSLDALAEDPTALQAWLSDPDFDGHGGESVTSLTRRVDAALEQPRAAGIVVVITSPAVLRAVVVTVLGAPARSWFAVDVAPLDAVEVTIGDRRRLRHLSPYPEWLQPGY